MTSTTWLFILTGLILLSVRDWTMFAPGCGMCGARRKDMHAKDCPWKHNGEEGE